MEQREGTYPEAQDAPGAVLNDDAAVGRSSEEVDDEMAPSTVGGQVLMPMRDMLGYSCFVAWAFLFGWCRNLSSIHGDDLFFSSRAFMFGGIALGAVMLFITRGDFLRGLKNKVAEWVFPLFCMVPGLTFMFPLDAAPSFGLWFISGLGQSAMFFLWGMRLRILSSDQQLYVICCGFVVGGSALAVAPFMMIGLVIGASILLPLVSFGLLRLARQRFEGNSARMTVWDGEKRVPNGLREFRASLPFKSDRKNVLFKGLFSCLYSIFLGFVTALVLSLDLASSEDVVIGLGNIVSALVVLLMLKGGSQGKEELLPRLFLPVTCIVMGLLGALWPTEWVLLCAFFLFLLFGCLEILNAYSAYVGTPYDAVRWFWEIQASRLGNSFGFFLGWLVAVLFGPWLTSSSYSFLLACFILSILAVIPDSLLFRRSIFETPKDVIDDDLAEMSHGGGLLATPRERPLRSTTFRSAKRWRESSNCLPGRLRYSSTWPADGTSSSSARSWCSQRLP